MAGGGNGWLAGIATDGTAWATQSGGGKSNVTALAAGGGVCYATTVGGRVERSLSAGRSFTLSLTAKPAATGTTFKAIVTTGARVSLSGSTSILAPGVLLVQARPAGATAWQTVAYGSPGASTLNYSDSPVTSTTYRLRFLFTGAAAATGQEVRVGVRHKVSVSSTSIKLSLGKVYGVSGSVSPAKPRGVVEVWTDRAGDDGGHGTASLAEGGYVTLVNGTTFSTRRFGTPVRETYHLKMLMRADSKHLSGWSPRITVTVR